MPTKNHRREKGERKHIARLHKEASRGMSINAIQNRIEIASFYRGGVVMTTLILIFGRTTPKIIRAFGNVLRYLAA